MNKQRTILFLIAIGLWAYGINTGEYKAVFNKAATICLECIGIG